MIDRLLQTIAPHYCYSCQKIGTLLCDSCIYNITSDNEQACVICGRLAVHGICATCDDTYSKAWCVGEREGVLARLVDDYKFERVKAFSVVGAKLLDAQIPLLPAATRIVPVPTIHSHIRQRGYDHTALLAKQFAALRGLTYAPIVERATSTHQRGASRRQRFSQAQRAFTATGKIDELSPVLLVDDILTTGATLHYAAHTLKAAGVQTVWVAVIARQPLDKTGSHLLK